MREVMFKAWLKNRKKMVKVKAIDFIEEQIRGGANWYDFDEVELMQYTGLKDKNGVEIYEGDIIKANPYGNDVVGKVCYTGFAYEVLEKTDNLFEDSGYKPMTCIESNVLYEAMKGHSLFGNRLEVIGNIYQNPELLEK